jgi:hypothetical protein
MRAVERLETAGGEARRGENDGKPDQPARLQAVLKPPH